MLVFDFFELFVYFSDDIGEFIPIETDARAARFCIFWARRSIGSAFGMPSSTDFRSS